MSTPVSRSSAGPAAHAPRLGRSRRARSLRGVGLAAAFLALPACYTAMPTTLSRLTPGDRLAVEVNDQGRAALGERIGPEIRRLSGTYVGETNGDLELRVLDVTNLDGARTTWSGESIKLRREHVKDVYERRFSRGRTAVAVGAVAAGLVAFVVSRGLFGFGAADDGDGGGNGGNQQ